MNGWQVQAMWEADAAAEWERLNAPDPCEKEMQKAAVDLRFATDLMDKAENSLYDALSELSETPMEDKVTSFLDDLQNLRIALQELAEKYGRGQRE